MNEEEEEYRPARRVARRPAVRTSFAEGAVEATGATLTSVDDTPVQQPQESGGTELRSGWGAGQQEFDRTSEYAQRFIPSDSRQVIKFLEDRPYVSYARHWVDRISQSGKPVSIPFACLGSYNEDCPLCNIGDKPQAVSAFNVALIDDDGIPSLKTWDVGVRVFKSIKQFHEDDAYGPLTSRYYIVQTSGARQNKQTNLYPQNAATLKEDLRIDVPTAEKLASLGLYDKSIIDKPRRSQLAEMAQEMAQADEA